MKIALLKDVRSLIFISEAFRKDNKNVNSCIFSSCLRGAQEKTRLMGNKRQKHNYSHPYRIKKL